MTSANIEANAICIDGACKGTRGSGGWAAVFYQDGERRILSGNDRSTTGNRMVVTATIRGLLATPEHQDIIVYSDSQYLINTMTRSRSQSEIRVYRPTCLGSAGNPTISIGSSYNS